MTMRRANHQSISNAQHLAIDDKKNNFTSSFQKLLTTYKKSKESQKSISHGGNSELLNRERNSIFSRSKLLKTEATNRGDFLGKQKQKSQKILSGKKTNL